MKGMRLAALVIASLLAVASLGGSFLARFDYIHQDRLSISASPSRQHWLGTDTLGRDRFSRLLHGTRVSLLLAPAAAVVSVLLAFVLGVVPGFIARSCESAVKILIDLMLSIPWLFLLLIVRALLPLNLSPGYSVTITFLMLGLLGWGVPARILMARAQCLRQSDFLLLARCAGVRPWRLLCVHLMPNLWPVLLAQFLIAVPVFILAEANLSLLGLGVSEPLPSLGSLLRELESVLSIQGEWCIFAPLVVLLVIVGSLQVAVSQPEVP